MAKKKTTKPGRKKASSRQGGSERKPLAAYSEDGRPLDRQGQARRGIVVRKDGRELDRFLVYLPLPLGQRLRVHCAATRQEISAVMAAAVEAYLGKYEG